MKTGPEAADEYLASQTEENRRALQKLRDIIRDEVPGAVECISYQLPAFRLDGNVLVLYGASAEHCAFYPGSGAAVEALRHDLRAYDTSKGAIRFQPGKPLPARLVRKVLRYRIAENAGTRRGRPGT